MHHDLVMNGQSNGGGAVAEELTIPGMEGFDKHLFRPFLARDGRTKLLTVNTGRTEYDPKTHTDKPIYTTVPIKKLQDELGWSHPVWNATTALRKEEWIKLDQVPVKAARYRQRAWTDLSAAASYNVNGMATLSLEHETMSDPGEAHVDLDGMTEGNNDYPTWQLEALPLPIIHSDYWFSLRKLSASRNGNQPLNVTMAEAASRRVAETVEKMTIGTLTGITYGPGSSTITPAVGRTSKIYGYTNFTNRLTYTGSAPTGSNASTILANVLAMKDRLTANKFYGPFRIYHSNDWDQYLDNDYILTGGNVATQTLRNRILSIQGIVGCDRLDQLYSAAPVAGSGGTGSLTYDTLYPFTMIMVQMDSNVAEAVNGMDLTTIQWESIGGQRLNFKVMCIQAPRLKADFYGNCGILHATFV
jgi:hypothetical protein